MTLFNTLRRKLWTRSDEESFDVPADDGSISDDRPQPSALGREPRSTAPGDLIYVGTEADLQHIDPANRQHLLVITGDVVIMRSLSKEQAPDFSRNKNFQLHSKRSTTRQDRSFTAWRTPPRSLHFAVHQGLLDAVVHLKEQHKSGMPTAIFAADAIMHLMKDRELRRQPKMIVLNGYHDHDRTYFDTYVFSYGQLIALKESVIRSPTHPRYGTDVQGLLDEVLAAHPDAMCLWTAPLVLPRGIDTTRYAITEYDDSIYTARGIHRIRWHINGARHTRPWLAPAAIVASTLAGGAIVIGTEGSAFQTSRDHYRAMTSKTETLPSTPLDTLGAREQWINLVKNTPIEITPYGALLEAIAQHPDWRVTNLAINIRRPDISDQQPGEQRTTATGSDASLIITLSVPMKGTEMPIQEAEPIVATLTNQSGLQLYVVQKGIRPDPAQKRLMIDISGDAVPTRQLTSTPR